MRSQIKLGRILGIQIGIHYSWFLIAFLIVLSLYSRFHMSNGGWSEPVILAMAVGTGILFFVFLLLHELSHSLFAKSHGIPVREITLFALGGVSQIEKNPDSAKSEFWMALVGPLTSAALGAMCLLVRLIAGAASSPAYTMLSWLGYINLALAAFNMVPGYPLDGGRILRAAVWWKSGNLEYATRQAAWVGQVVGGIFIAVGIVQFFGGAGFSGLWIAFIGWFLLQAAGESILEAGIAHVLEGATAAQVMTPDCPVVSGNLTLQHFVEDRLLRTGDRCFMVMDNDGLVGLVTAHEIKTVNRARWPFMTVFDVMRPITEIRTIQPGTPLKAALEIMSRENLNQLPVVKGNHVEGVLTRSRLLSFLHNRFELQS